MSETHISDVNARFPSKSANHYQFESYLQSGVMTRGLPLIAPDKKWLAGSEKCPRPPWDWRNDIDRCRDEPGLTQDDRQPFLFLNRLLSAAFNVMKSQAADKIECSASLAVAGECQALAHTQFKDTDNPFNHPYYWAGFVVMGDGEVRCVTGEILIQFL